MIKRLAALIGLVAIIAIIGIVYYVLNKPINVRLALPLRAVVTMHEYYLDFAPLPDFIHCVSTEVTEREFKSFVTQMKLVPYRGAKSFPICLTGWWAGSGDSSLAFYDPTGKEETQTMAKFEKGALYFVTGHP